MRDACKCCSGRANNEATRQLPQGTGTIWTLSIETHTHIRRSQGLRFTLKLGLQISTLTLSLRGHAFNLIIQVATEQFPDHFVKGKKKEL